MKTNGARWACPTCGSSREGASVDLGVVPAQSTALHPDRASACRATTGRIRLIDCPGCGLVSNVDFDPDLVPYDAHYENSQFFSPRFRSYAAGLAERLVDDHDLTGRHVIEVGSGKGEFLAELRRAGVGRATGFDPTYDGEIDEQGLTDVVVVPEAYGPGSAVDPGAVVCRHVLEHLPDPVAFLSDIRRAMGTSTPLLYLEVPNRAVTFTASGLWDVIYQHCSYFDARSLSWVARAAGLEVLRCGTALDDQFLFLEATPAAGPTPTLDEGPDGEGPGVEDLAALHERVVAAWRHRLTTWAEAGRAVALWGAGAKGVTFLNLVAGDAVDTVIDRNPRKRGRFLPGTGHRVMAPEDLGAAPVDEIIVVNALYREEIAAQVDALGLRAQLTCL